MGPSPALLPAPPHYTLLQAEALAAGVRNATSAGFLVRARADADTVEARAGFTGRRDAVIAAGPQVRGEGACCELLPPVSCRRLPRQRALE